MPINEDGAVLVTAEHEPWCEKKFRSERGQQAGMFGLLRCQCGKPHFYMLPLRDE